jgi:Protein of unknown function (DUF3501)
MSGPLTLTDIADLRAYERERDEFRREVIALKRLRRIAVGPLVSLVFENRTTVRFQIQEMARAEKMATDEEIADELAVYNPLIPGRGELSMTMFIELTDEVSLREWLPRLVGIERAVVVTVGEGAAALRQPAEVDPQHASQLTREEVTASVHYVRVQLPEAAIDAFATSPVLLSIDHPEYRYEVALSAETKASLAADWS